MTLGRDTMVDSNKARASRHQVVVYLDDDEEQALTDASKASGRSKTATFRLALKHYLEHDQVLLDAMLNISKLGDDPRLRRLLSDEWKRRRLGKLGMIPADEFQAIVDEAPAIYEALADDVPPPQKALQLLEAATSLVREGNAAGALWRIVDAAGLLASLCPPDAIGSGTMTERNFRVVAVAPE